MCCSGLQWIAACDSDLNRRHHCDQMLREMCRSELQRVAVSCSELQWVAVGCSGLQQAKVCDRDVLQCAAACCNALQ